MPTLKPTEASTSLTVPSLIVTPTWVSDHLNHPALRIVDVRPRMSYEDRHLPGAVWLDLSRLDDVIEGVAGMLLPPDRYAEEIGKLGIGDETAIVLYDDNWGMPAARVLWSLARYGHKNVAVLTGGVDRWQEEGYSLSTEPVRPTPATFTVRPDDEQVASLAWLRSRLDSDQTVVIDTRTPREYGFGHLPGAVCWDWMNGVPITGWDALRSEEELREELADLGITPDKEIVTYCRSGARASHTYLLLRQLEFPHVRVYDGSWLEWAQRAQDDTKGGTA